ncbi:hypothetical protein GXW74_19915 [Roseomonas eburnea]|uniref:Uncharacterized protein n=1 Tax=Neoroseomonas eburnea TaxID=1346889 RepID=A0A9X9XGD3_9PROT|nr:hypothetical protein [Neoroseomonas eburnea]MBR0682769.1 hypothetical protein [Neoroseomonas eburnea]
MKTVLGIGLSVVLLLLARAIGRATSGTLYRLSSGYPQAEDWMWIAALGLPAGAVIAAFLSARRVTAEEGRAEYDTAKLARGLLAIGGAALAVGALFAISSDRYDTTRDLGLVLGVIGACLAAVAWYLRGLEA